MQKILLILIFLFIPCFTLFAQQVDPGKKIRVKGILYDAKTMDRVPFVHIIDISRNKGTSADDKGNFSFQATVGDSIRFTAIGYEDYFMVIDDSLSGGFIDIRIQPKSYMLDALDFYAKDPMHGFYLKDIKRDTIRMGNIKGNPGASYWNGTPSGGSGYVTAFANLFNRHHKQEKKLAEIKAEEQAKKIVQQQHEEERQQVNSKYNEELVNRITDLEGEELTRFMEVYGPSKQFILNSSEYEIALQIVNAYRDYRFENGLEVDMSEILERAKFRD